MKVILIDEVRGLGGRGEVVTVRDGYARNYLLPKQLAREATSGNLRAAEMERKKWANLTQQEKEASQRAAVQLEGVTVVVHKRVGETGTLFGSVTSAEIADALAGRGIEIDKRRIELGQTIKSLGAHEVDVHLHREVSARMRVEVVGAVEKEYAEVRLPGEEPKTPQAEPAAAAPPAEAAPAEEQPAVE